MLRRLLGLILIGMTACSAAWAQQEPSFAHYWAMEPSFNPAAAGKDPVLNVAGAYDMTLVGFEHNPKTMYVGGDMQLFFLGAYHGVGLQLMNDDIGLFSHQRLAVQYAYKHKLFGGTISVGLQVGMLSEKFKGSELDLEQDQDDAFTKTDVNGMAMDVSAGIYYKHRNWYAGVSVLHATAPTIELGERSIYEMKRQYYLTGGYNIKLRNPFLTIHPSVLAHTDGSAYRVDVTTRVKYTHDQKMLYAGVAYSPSNSVTALIGGNFHGITLGYSYEMYTSVLKIGNGSHELFIGYQTEINLGKKGRNRHQSVRIL
ncbi:MAG: type IX secretion system membrane protein PorP/SprF [Prevotella sp.]|nr:type IX secretion system membrane protein PorP/SprF [Prevotella sp.]